MAMYEMKVEMYKDYDGKIHEFCGSELFEAATMKKALKDAMLSEYDEINRAWPGANWAMFEEHATVDWKNGSGQHLYEYIEMEEVKDGE